MEAIGVIGGVASVTSLVDCVVRLAKTLNDLREKYDSAALNISLVASSLWTIRAALEAIDAWRNSTKDSSQSSRQLDFDLSISLESCAVLVAVIDRKLGETNLTKPSVFDKLRFVSLDSLLKDFTSNLDGQVRALQLLLTIFQWYTPRVCRFSHSDNNKSTAELSRSKRSDWNGRKHVERYGRFGRILLPLGWRKKTWRMLHLYFQRDHL